MKKYFYRGLLLICFLNSSCNPGPKKDLNSLSQEHLALVSALDSIATHFISQNDLPGALVGLLENGRHIKTLYYGHADTKTKQKIDGSTLFNLGSISKSATAWGILKLVEENKLALDSPATKYLRRWRFPPHEFDESKITVRRLLGHSAGLSLSGYPGFKDSLDLPSVVESLNGATNGPERVSVIYEPGTAVRYSGGGFTVLQLIIEEVSQMPFADFMDKNIFGPLEMEHTTFKTIDVLHPLKPKLAKPYDGDGMEIEDRSFTALAAAGLRSSHDDMLKFILAELQLGPNKILAKNSIMSMHSANPPADRYGLGHQIRSFGTKTIIGHVGNNQGWHGNFEFIPETKSGIIILTNGNDGFYFHNTIMCHWIDHQTGKQSLEFCATLPLAKIGILQEKVLQWHGQKYITAIQKDALLSQFHKIRTIGPSAIETVIKGLGDIQSDIDKKCPGIPKTDREAYRNFSKEVVQALDFLPMDD